jgi:Xaa-Pro aminopeptidase
MYDLNRQKLFEKMPKNSVALIFSGQEQIRNNDVDYPFRASSDFIYLTGFHEPDAALLMVKADSIESILFLRPRDPEKEVWDGRRLGVERAPATLGLDKAYEIDELDDLAPELIANAQTLMVSFSDFEQNLSTISPWIETLKKQSRKALNPPSEITDLDVLLHEMRLIKSQSEIELMKKAAEISVQGHLAAMQKALTSEFEFEVQAELESSFIKNGSPRVAFNSIVASQANACILHYTENRDALDKNALVLVDAGAEYKGYAGDITTTFPVSGQFTQAQAQLYNLVLKAQQAVIAIIKPGLRYDELHQKTLSVLVEGLIDLGLLTGTLEDNLSQETYKRFFMHGTGHWLGMDVHDVGQYKVDGQWRELQAGMVLTVEPGLYISSEHTDIESQWHDIGIRIEDDVLVTETGAEVLTQGLPRTVEEIETFMNVVTPIK